MKTIFRFITSSLALLALSAQGDIIELQLEGNGGGGLLSTNVNGALNGVPGSGGIGAGGISLDTDTNELSIDLAWGSGNGFTDLTSNVSVMHIHGPTANAAPTGFGENAGVLVGLSGFDPSATDGSYVGTVTLTQPQEDDILAGRAYINVHTSTNGGGEIRGHLVPTPAPSSLLFTEDFSSGDGGFTVTSEGGHTDPWAYDPGAGSWSTDGSEIGTPSQHTRLTSPELTIETAGAYVLFFSHRYDIEGGNWDGGAVFLSVNGGPFTYLENTEFTENGYTTGALIGAHALNGLTAFGGISSGHPAGTFITSEAGPFALDAGDTLQIQFLMANDEFAVGTMTPNWEIDEVTVATLNDRDGDGMPDFYEEANGLNPDLDDANDDLDMDDASNFTEFVNGTDPQDPDSDDDTLIDGVETNTGEWLSASDTGTDPLNPDSDGDGLSDGVETNTLVFVDASNPGTNPNLADTDGDGFDDSLEIDNGTDPTSASSFPQVGALLRVDLVAYWPMDGDLLNAQTEVVDDYHGMEDGGVIPFEPGKFGEAIRLDGTQSVIIGGDENVFDFAGESMSVSVWATASAIDTSWQCLIAKGEGNGWRMHRRGGDIPEIMSFTGGNGDVPAHSTPIIIGGDPETWHHWVGVTDSETMTEYLYQDGELLASMTGATLVDRPNPMRIGDNPDALNRRWKGKVDDVAIWNRALSDLEVAYLWDGGTGRSIGPSGQGFRIINIAFNKEGQVELTFSSKAGTGYAIEATGNLETGPWIEIDDMTGTGPTDTYTYASPIPGLDPSVEPVLFWRVRDVTTP